MNPSDPSPGKPGSNNVVLPQTHPQPKGNSNSQTRIEPAPVPIGDHAAVPSNRPMSVELRKGEQVEWIWTTLASGVSYVSGYQIITGDQKDKLPDGLGSKFQDLKGTE